MMQGQSSHSNSFPQNRCTYDGPRANNLQLVPHNVVSEDGHITLSYTGQSNSSRSIQNLINPEELNAGNGWLSFVGANSGHGQRSGGTHSGPNSGPSLERVNTIIVNGPASNGQSTLHSGSPNVFPQTIDLNAECEADGDQDVEPGLCIHLFSPGGSQIDQVAPPQNSSSSGVISSGTAGHVVEENHNTSVPSSDDRCPSCKRKAPENAFRQLSLGGSSSSSHDQAENSKRQALSLQENTSGILDISTSSGNASNVSYLQLLNSSLEDDTPRAGSNMHQSSGAVAGNAENLQRNVHSRNENQQYLVPANIASSGTPITNSRNQPPSQPSGFLPFEHSSAPVPATLALNNRTFQVPPSVHVPNTSQPLQPSQLTSSRADNESNIAQHNRLPLLSNATLPGGLADVLGNVAFASENGSGSGIRQSNVVHNSMISSFGGYDARWQSSYHAMPPSAVDNGMQINNHPPPHLANSTSGTRRNDQTSRSNDSIVIGGSSNPPVSSPVTPPTGGQIIRVLPTLGASTSSGLLRPRNPRNSAAMHEVAVPAGPSNVRPPTPPFRLNSIARRQMEGLPFAAGDPRRRRLIAEVRNAVGLVRRNGALQFEDVMIIDRSVLYGLPEWNEEDDFPDIHGDMRLDVDNMTYEELLELGEHIGNVNTGLSEEAIQARLRRQNYHSIRIGSPVEDEPCCICQEEYVDGEELGKLDCRHDFHFNCIKQWLLRKNTCPVCKMTALAN